MTGFSDKIPQVIKDDIVFQKLSAQLPLRLNLKEEATFENYFATKNLEAVTLLQKLASGESYQQVIYLLSQSSPGSTHLLQACCHKAHQNGFSSLYLPLQEWVAFYEQNPHLGDIDQLFASFEASLLVCLDDIHAIAGKRDWEEAIFHLYNQVYDAGGHIVIAGNDLPKALPFSLPDLVSRLSGGILYTLQLLSDEEKLMVLIQRAKRRGIHLSRNVGQYIITHCPRHMGTLCAAFDALDKASLVAKRRLTIPFVKAVLQI